MSKILLHISANRHSKVKASSLLEVVIALLLICIMMVLSMNIFTNVIQSGFNNRKIEAGIKIKELSFISKKEHNFINEEFRQEEYLITKSVEFYKQSANLIHIRWKAEDLQGKLLLETDEIILTDTKDED